MASQERFGFKWTTCPQLFLDDTYQEHVHRWLTPLEFKDFKGKTVLDAGCGPGRISYFLLKAGARVTAFDYDPRTVELCRRNLELFPHKEIQYLSIYDIPWKNCFDIAISTGVIHHLKDQPLAVKKLVEATKPGGSVLVWLYGREHNGWIIYFINPIRFITSRLPITWTSFISYFFSVALYCRSHYLPSRSPYMELLKKCNFSRIHELVFDHLLPRIAKYYRKDEAIELLKNAGLENVQVYPVNNNSWSVIGTKPKMEGRRNTKKEKDNGK